MSDSQIDSWIRVCIAIFMTCLAVGCIGFLVLCVRHWREFWELPTYFESEDKE